MSRGLCLAFSSAHAVLSTGRALGSSFSWRITEAGWISLSHEVGSAVVVDCLCKVQHGKESDEVLEYEPSPRGSEWQWKCIAQTVFLRYGRDIPVRSEVIS
ncbi:hypothetical protein KC19_6G114000 [Ceratodon purpureus]|uniref:Uncharacterized protein n=1 Tax=Ceratodon purpureus TaxID=3225 RepID=A0A8T0HH96_CERPU|nr:hypothetical protein KC19_6G114000 [Ceratodon purpureus]